jgi:hypothetical protein
MGDSVRERAIKAAQAIQDFAGSAIDAATKDAEEARSAAEKAAKSAKLAQEQAERRAEAVIAQRDLEVEQARCHEREVAAAEYENMRPDTVAGTASSTAAAVLSTLASAGGIAMTMVAGLSNPVTASLVIGGFTLAGAVSIFNLMLS